MYNILFIRTRWMLYSYCHLDRKRAHKHLCAWWSGEISDVVWQWDYPATPPKDGSHRNDNFTI